MTDFDKPNFILMYVDMLATQVSSVYMSGRGGRTFAYLDIP